MGGGSGELLLLLLPGGRTARGSEFVSLGARTMVVCSQPL